MVASPPLPVKGVQSREQASHRELPTLRQRTVVGSTRKQDKWQMIELVFAGEKYKKAIYELPLGGKLVVVRGLLDPLQCQEYMKELFETEDTLFRQYKIENQPEPRVHFLLHEKGSLFPEQDEVTTGKRAAMKPTNVGYRYNGITMLAKPLTCCPRLRALSQELLPLCGSSQWGIGVNPVLYRDGVDSLDFHADNNQGEKVIMTLLLSVPAGQTGRRPVFIKGRPSIKEGTNRSVATALQPVSDELYELILAPGDAYIMDEQMQGQYLHSVEKTITRKKLAAAGILGHLEFK